MTRTRIHNLAISLDGFAITACLVAALASAFRGGKYIHDDDEPETSSHESPAPAELVAEGAE